MNKFIVLEGCDCVGKSSSAIMIAKAINGIYYKTPPQSFKDLRPAVEEMNNLNLRFYYFLTGTILASHEIQKLLQSSHVVCDRYIFTTIASHRALGISVPKHLERLVYPPDYCFCLHARADELKRRATLRIEKKKTLSLLDADCAYQKKYFQEFKKFPLTFIDNSSLTIEESVRIILRIIRL